MIVREPAVAGTFYPDHPDRLRRDLERFLGHVEGEGHDPPPKALIVPHAGYIYSGEVAGSVYRRLGPVAEGISRVVLLGPAHTVYLEGMAVPEADCFSTPLGHVPLDQQAIETITSLPGVVHSNAAHSREHSLEVQLPFLQVLLGEFRLVPLVVGHCDPDLVAAVIDTLWGGPETLIVVSSDLSHFLPYGEARDVDSDTCRRIIDKSSSLIGEQACGAYAINGLMRSRHCQELSVEAVDLRNSGDTAGDKRRVVGYGAFLLN